MKNLWLEVGGHAGHVLMHKGLYDMYLSSEVQLAGKTGTSAYQLQRSVYRGMHPNDYQSSPIPLMKSALARVLVIVNTCGNVKQIMKPFSSFSLEKTLVENDHLRKQVKSALQSEYCTPIHTII